MFADRQRLAAVALVAQAAAGFNRRDDLLDWLGNQVAQKTIPESQRQQFFKQFVATDLQVRRNVGPSDPIAYLASFKVRRPDRGWWYRLTFLTASLDGKPLRGTGGSSSSGSGGGGGSIGSTVASTQPGRHSLAVTERVEILPGSYLSGDTPVYRSDVTDSADFQVLADSGARIRETDDPNMASLIRRNLHARDFVVDPVKKSIEGKVQVKVAPANLAFDVLVRAGGKEYPVGSYALGKGTGTDCFLFGSNFDAGPIDHVDIVLRSSPAVARRTVDLFEIWKGEVVLGNVPVKVRSP